MKTQFLLIVLIAIPFLSKSQSRLPKESDANSIRSIMKKQETTWNSGDLKAFMEGYWESEKLMFIGKNGITYGWQATLDRYIKSYPDKATMGKLQFTLLEMKKLSGRQVLVIGKWELFREKGDVSGHFSLIWEKIKGEWKIIADHSS